MCVRACVRASVSQFYAMAEVKFWLSQKGVGDFASLFFFNRTTPTLSSSLYFPHKVRLQNLTPVIIWNNCL